MEKAIRSSIEGGWRCHAVNQAYLLFDKIENIEVFVNGFGWVIFHRKGTEPIRGIFTEKVDSMRVEQVYSDRTFWQALGKVEGWCEGKKSAPDGLCSNCSFPNCSNNWINYWHNFIDQLAEGKSVDDFFDNL